MPKFKFTEGGRTYSVTANSADEAAPMIDDVVKHLRAQSSPTDPMADEGAAQASAAGQMLPMLKEGINKFTPVGSVNEINGQLEGTRPSSALSAGLAGVDVAGSLLMPFARKAGAAFQGLGAVGKTALADLGIGAAAGATSEGAQMAGLPAPIAMPLGIAAGMATGKRIAPEMTRRAVPQGQEAQALSRAVQKMGLPVPLPASNAPEDVMTAWARGRDVAGEAVGKAKEAALQTSQSTPDVLARVMGGIEKTARGVSPEAVISGKLLPGATKNKRAAEFVAGALEDISTIPEGIPANQAMKILNNKLESAKTLLETQESIGAGVPGRITGKAISRWQRVLNALGPKEQVAVARATDSAFSKLVTLQELAEKASTTMAEQSPTFRARNFVFDWQRMPLADKAKFSAEEKAILDALTKQEAESALAKAAQWVINQKKIIGSQALTFHPTARFYEPAVKKLPPRAGGASAISTLRPQFIQALNNQENQQ